MDNIARLQRQKLRTFSQGKVSIMVLPLVTKPPEVRPRVMASRLLLHLPHMYAAIRRYLMYILFNGDWLPPNEPDPNDATVIIDGAGDVSYPTSRSSDARSTDA